MGVFIGFHCLLSTVYVIFLNIEMTLCVFTHTDHAPCFCLKEEVSKLRNPVHIEPAVIDEENVYYIGEQIGVIYEYRPLDQNSLTKYIDLSDRVVCQPELYEERGLLGFALHPKFVSNQKLYTYTIRSLNNRDYAVVSEIKDGNVAQERKLILIEQPGLRRNGGQLIFGTDGFLYISVGDGGPGDDTQIQSQNGSSFLGKVLRIDVDKTTVVDFREQYYDIPNDNPKTAGWKPEVFAIGTRNMWRCGKDAGDIQGKGKERIFCGDLGSSVADEIVELKKGANYGWPYREGTHCRNESICKTKANEETLPIFEVRREMSNVSAVVGGPLYRGSSFPDLYGQLVYGDFALGKLYSLDEHPIDAMHSNWTSGAFVQCDKSRCPCDARAPQRTMLLSIGQTHHGELLLLMTDEPNPGKSFGALLSLQPPLDDVVTCSSPLWCTSSVALLICFFISHCLIKM